MPYIVFDQFSLGPLTIHTWGLLVGLAFTAGYFLLMHRAAKNNIAPEKIAWLSLVSFVGAVLGSRLLFLLQTPQRFFNDISLLWSPNSGAMFLGGLLGAILFGWLYIKFSDFALWREASFWPIADLAAPAIALGIGIGRLGCALINDHVGSITNLPWGILWPDGIARHPVALYESLAGFILFALLWQFEKKLKQKGGLFLLLLSGIGVFRFFLDFTRVSHGVGADIHFYGLSTSQWIAAVMFIFTTALLVLRQKKDKPLYTIL